jgi:hypothetical protein
MQRSALAGMIWIAGLILAARPGAAQQHSSSTLIVPADLYRYADSLGCDQVTDFYEDREGVLHPPFVYVDAVAPWWDTAAALWCRPRGGPAGRYTLLLRFGSKSGPMGRCPIRIEGQQHIGGLSVVKLKQTLDHFRYVDEPTKTGPAIQPSDVGIQSEYDGTGAIFYCHEGRWLRSSLH